MNRRMQILLAMSEDKLWSSPRSDAGVNLRDIKEKCLLDEEVRKEYDALETEYAQIARGYREAEDASAYARVTEEMNSHEDFDRMERQRRDDEAFEESVRREREEMEEKDREEREYEAEREEREASDREEREEREEEARNERYDEDNNY